MDRGRGLFGVALVVGVLLAVVSLSFGLLGMATVLVVMTVIGLAAPGSALLAGGWLALGGTWLVLIGRASVQCSALEMPCGATPPDMTWLLVVASVVALGGCLVGLASLRRSTSS